MSKSPKPWKPPTARAWGYWCRGASGELSELARIVSVDIPACANPTVRVRILPEADYRRVMRERTAGQVLAQDLRDSIASGRGSAWRNLPLALTRYEVELAYIL